MNRKERRRARLIFLFPLMFALTGLALLLLQWSLQFTDMDAFAKLKPLFERNWYIVVFPVLLMLLYLLRINPTIAYIAAGFAAVLFLLQVIAAWLTGTSAARGYAVYVPAHTLFSAIAALRKNKDLSTILSMAANASLILTNFSAIFTCLYYASVKHYSDQRHEDALAAEEDDELNYDENYDSNSDYDLGDFEDDLPDDLPVPSSPEKE